MKKPSVDPRNVYRYSQFREYVVTLASQGGDAMTEAAAFEKGFFTFGRCLGERFEDSGVLPPAEDGLPRIMICCKPEVFEQVRQLHAAQIVAVEEFQLAKDAGSGNFFHIDKIDRPSIVRQVNTKKEIAHKMRESMKAIETIIRDAMNEPVVTNAVRRARGKPALGYDALETMAQLDNLATSLLASKQEIFVTPELKKVVTEKKIFDLRIVDTLAEKNKDKKGFRVAKLGQFKKEASEIDETVARIRSIILDLDMGAPISDLVQRIKTVMDDSGSIDAKMAVARAAAYPSSQTWLDMSAREEKMGAWIEEKSAALQAMPGRVIVGLTSKARTQLEKIMQALESAPATPAAFETKGVVHEMKPIKDPFNDWISRARADIETGRALTNNARVLGVTEQDILEAYIGKDAAAKYAR